MYCDSPNGPIRNLSISLTNKYDVNGVGLPDMVCAVVLSEHSLNSGLIHPSIRLPIHLSIHPYIHSPIHPSTHTSIYQSIYSSIHPSIRPSIHTYIHPSIHSFTQPPIHP